MSKAWTLRPDGWSRAIVSTYCWQHTGQTKSLLFQALSVSLPGAAGGQSGALLHVASA